MAVQGLTNAMVQQNSSTSVPAPASTYVYQSAPAQAQGSTASMGGALPEYTIPGFNPPSAQYQSQNPNLNQIMQDQLKQASDYQKNAPGMVNSQANLYNRNSKAQLAQGIQQTRQNFNTRGMLKSGQRQGAEYAQSAASGADMANNRYNLNQNSLSTQNQLEQNAYNTGLLYSGNTPNVGAQALEGTAIGVQNDISNLNNSGQVSGAIGSGIGKLAGTIASQNTATNPNYGTGYGTGYGNPASGLGIDYSSLNPSNYGSYGYGGY